MGVKGIKVDHPRLDCAGPAQSFESLLKKLGELDRYTSRFGPKRTLARRRIRDC